MDDQYTAAQQFNKRAFTKVFDEEGAHTIRLENNGLKNPSATGNSFNIDCFKVFKEKEAVKDSNADLASLSYVLNDGAPTAVEGFSAEKTSYEEPAVRHPFRQTMLRSWMEKQKQCLL